MKHYTRCILSFRTMFVAGATSFGGDLERILALQWRGLKRRNNFGTHHFLSNGELRRSSTHCLLITRLYWLCPTLGEPGTFSASW